MTINTEIFSKIDGAPYNTVHLMCGVPKSAMRL